MFSIRVVGPAGKGVRFVGKMLGEFFAYCGYLVFTDSEYQSRIRGGENWFDVGVDSSSQYLTQKKDVCIVWKEENLKNVYDFLKSGGIIFFHEYEGEKYAGKMLPSYKRVAIPQCEGVEESIQALGCFLHACFVTQEEIKDFLLYSFGKETHSFFQNYEKILRVWEVCRKQGEPLLCIRKREKHISIAYGNTLLVEGALDAGLEFYAGYPMTPSTSILTEMVTRNTVTFQGEDEIAVIMAALGASFAGKRSMVATSGGGFALMVEALSFSVMAEIPVTVVLSQRAGPSTGMPTKHEQGDITFALFPTFGDYEHVVIAPYSLEQVYLLIGFALHVAERYQQFVIFLMDKQLSELFATYEKPSLLPIDRGKDVHSYKNYLRYAVKDDGISPRMLIDEKGEPFMCSSYEHSESGESTEDPEIRKMMVRKRFQKLKNFYKDIPLKGYDIFHQGAKKLLITLGANFYVAKEFILQNPEYGLLVVYILKPLHVAGISPLLHEVTEIIFIEANYSGQFERYFLSHFPFLQGGNVSIKHVRKYDGMPFFLEDVYAGIFGNS